MTRLLALASFDGRETQLVQEGSSLRIAPGERWEADPLLVTLLRERNLRVGTGHASGDGVFDFRYGPFTGGLGESGIFHLSTYGERILAVDIDLSAKHRAIESSLTGRSCTEALATAQTVCGNFAFANQEAFASAVEGALGLERDELSRRLALVALELERIYNHLYVITRLAEAAAQRVLASHLGALFEESLRTNREFSGSRFLWNTRSIGGMSASLAPNLSSVAERVRRVAERFARLYEASLANRNYLDRLHGIAAVTSEAQRWSLTGPALRAAGVADDLRTAEPLLNAFSPVIQEEGDSLARMELRAEELLQSCGIIAAQLGAIEASPALRALLDRSTGSPKLGDEKAGEIEAASGVGTGAAEGATGVIAWAVSIRDGRVASAVASTPSFFGFQVFAEVFAGHIFTDFPFALDSFGLSFADAAR